MNRRNFLKTGMLGAMIAASPISFSAFGQATTQTGRSGRLNLRFRPYELQLRHAFNLARSQRTTTPGVQVEIEYDGIIGYGEASMPPYLGENVASVTEIPLETRPEPVRRPLPHRRHPRIHGEGCTQQPRSKSIGRHSPARSYRQNHGTALVQNLGSQSRPLPQHIVYH